VQLREHRHNLKELLEKFKLAQHAYEEAHIIIWDEDDFGECKQQQA
jgi:hypothetical protein